MSGNPSRLNGTQWAQVRAAYEAPGANVSGIARRYGISRQNLLDRAKRYGWTKGERVEPDASTGEASDTELAGTDGSASPAETHESGLDDGVRVRVLNRHQVEWAPHRRLLRTAQRILFDPGWKPEAPKGPKADEDAKPEPVVVTWAMREKHATKMLELAKLYGSVLSQGQRGERDAFMILGTWIPSLSRSASSTGISPAEALKAVLMEIDAMKARTEIEGKAITVR